MPKKLRSPPVLTKQCGVVQGMVDRWQHARDPLIARGPSYSN